MSDAKIGALILTLAALFFLPIFVETETEEVAPVQQVEAPKNEAEPPEIEPTRMPTPTTPTVPSPTPTGLPSPTEEPEPTIEIPVMHWEPDIQDEEKLRFIQENGLEYVRLSCYLPTGNCTADGTIPYEGICASNYQHLGMKCVMYNNDLQPVAVWECHDVGGNELLQAGKAIDVYRDNMDRAWELIGLYGDHVYIKWIE